jgi:hypothetical protein
MASGRRHADPGMTTGQLVRISRPARTAQVTRELAINQPRVLPQIGCAGLRGGRADNGPALRCPSPGRAVGGPFRDVQAGTFVTAAESGRSVRGLGGTPVSRCVSRMVSSRSASSVQACTADLAIALRR